MTFMLRMRIFCASTAQAGATAQAVHARLCGMCGRSGSDVYAVGNAGTILHFDGDAWTAMTSGTSSDLFGVAGSTGGDVFAVGQGGLILGFDGAHWWPMASGTTSDFL